MWSAACVADVSKALVSLQTARQHLKNFINEFASAGMSKCRHLYRVMLDKVVQKLLPSRSDRIEPRVLKRRPKSYPRMTKPRHTIKTQIAA
jgi:hypothetical protein